jgi:hypothetical protein
MKKSLLIVLTAMILTACSNVPREITIDAAPIAKQPLIVPNVDTYQARNVEWIIVTPDNVEEIFQQLGGSNTDVVLFSVTDEGYQNLSLNMADIIKLLKQQQSIIAAYKQYYEETE